MKEITFTLLADGSSDAVLIPIIKWSLRQSLKSVAIQAEMADLRRLPNPPHTLQERICTAINLYPCDVLFVHRDAENQDPELRYQEIKRAMSSLDEKSIGPNYVCVVPVRMQEAWMLIDHSAIRRAAGNPNSAVMLEMPAIGNIESITDPKVQLYDLLKEASELKGRRLKKFRPDKHVHLIAENISDFLPLRQLSAFQRLEAEISEIVNKLFPKG
jgi:hypothetical protein